MKIIGRNCNYRAFRITELKELFSRESNKKIYDLKMLQILYKTFILKLIFNQNFFVFLKFFFHISKSFLWQFNIFIGSFLKIWITIKFLIAYIRFLYKENKIN